MQDTMKELLVQLALGALTVISTALLAYLRQGARKLALIADAKLSEQTWKDIDATLQIAVRSAEEYARRELSRGNARPSGMAKMDVAVDVAKRIAPEAMRYYDDETLRLMIDSKLSQERATLVPSREVG